MGDKRAHAEAWGPAWSSWEWGPSAQRGGAGTAGGLRCRERWGNVNNTEWGGGQSVVKPVSGELDHQPAPTPAPDPPPRPLLMFHLSGVLSHWASPPSFVGCFCPSVSLFLSSSLFPFSFLCISVSFSDSLFFPFYFCLSMSLFSVSLFVSLFLPLPLCLSCSGSLSISGSLHLCLFLGKSHMAVRGSHVLGSGRVRPPCGCEGGAFRALSICLKNPGEAGSGSTPTPTHWRFQWAPLAGRPSQFCLQASRSHQVETFSGEPEKGVLTL